MTIAQTHPPTSETPLRLWPGVLFLIVQWLLWFVLPLVAPERGFVALIGGAVCALAIAVWWIFFSRAPWSERAGAIVLIVVAVVATKRVVHESIAGAGMGMLIYISSIPYLSLALVAWAMIADRLSGGARRAALVAGVLLACAPWTLLRTAGVGGGGSEFHWRWTPTPEQRLLARANDEPTPLPASTPPVETPKESPTPKAESTPLDSARGTPAAAASATPAKTERVARAVSDTPAEWPGFRGGNRDGIVRGVRIETDWAKSPPVQMWRRPIGPAWSSFAVHGDLLYTQEQRGDDEIVACYRVSTGQPVWRHRDAVRFWESNGGAGPRATPTLSNGRVFAFGATGILNALDANNGAALWSRNVATDTGRKVPDWGFSSSPLVMDDIVIVAAAGTLAAYDAASGNRRWVGPAHGGSYSSPHLVTIDGIPQVVLLEGSGALSVSPANGAVLWEHAWEGGAIVQPAMIADGDIIINAIAMTGGLGTRRIAVAHGSGGWTVEERWTSTGLKPYFNDFVIHKGYAFGFDGSILACIDLKDGTRKWKGGRYGNGQLVLLPEQDLLLVLSEEGELVLVGATPDQFRELARVPALNGKTWNHPVLVRDVLLVRNGEEMAAFRLALASR
jgi:outer membrane protein assembly factor BamB